MQPSDIVSVIRNRSIERMENEIARLERELERKRRQLEEFKNLKPPADTETVVNGLSIDSLKLSTRTHNCLMRAGFKSVKELTVELYSTLDNPSFLTIPNFGSRSFKELLGALYSNGHIDEASFNAVQWFTD